MTIDDVLDHLLPDDWRESGVHARRRPVDRRRRRGAGGALRRAGPSCEGAGELGLDGARPAPPRPRSGSTSRARRAASAARLRPRGVRAVLGADRAFLGTGRFLVYMTVFIIMWVIWNVRARRSAVRPVPVHLPDADAVAPGLVRRAADPAGAEPPGRPRPGHPASRTASRTSVHRRHRVPDPGDRGPADGLGEVATRDWIRSELQDLLKDLERAAAAPAREVTYATVTARRRPLARRTIGRMATGTRPAPYHRPYGTEDAVREALATVNDPEIHRPITDWAWSNRSTSRRTARSRSRST